MVLTPKVDGSVPQTRQINVWPLRFEETRLTQGELDLEGKAANKVLPLALHLHRQQLHRPRPAVLHHVGGSAGARQQVDSNPAPRDFLDAFPKKEQNTPCRWAAQEEEGGHALISVENVAASLNAAPGPHSPRRFAYTKCSVSDAPVADTYTTAGGACTYI